MRNQVLLVFIILLYQTEAIDTLRIARDPLTPLSALSSTIDVSLPPFDISGNVALSVWIKVEKLTSPFILFLVQNSASTPELGLLLKENALSQYPDTSLCASSYVDNEWVFLALDANTSLSRLFKQDVQVCSQTYSITVSSFQAQIATSLVHFYRFDNLGASVLYLHNFRAFLANLDTLPSLSETSPSPFLYYALSSHFQRSSGSQNSTLILPGQAHAHTIVTMQGPQQQTQRSSLNILLNDQKGFYLNPSSRTYVLSSYGLRYREQIMTLEVWALPESVASSGTTAYSIRFAFLMQVQLFLGIAIDTSYQLACLEEGGGSNPPKRVFTNTVSRYRWSHLACAVSGTAVQGFIDGEGTTASTVNANSNYGRRIGFGTDGSDGAIYGGYLQEARVWRRRLTAGEIKQRMRQSLRAQQHSTLIAYFPLTEGHGDALFDNSAHSMVLKNSNFAVAPNQWTNVAWSDIAQVKLCGNSQNAVLASKLEGMSCVEANTKEQQYLYFDGSTPGYLDASVPQSAGMASLPATYEFWVAPQADQKQYLIEAVSSLSVYLDVSGVIVMERYSASGTSYVEYVRSGTQADVTQKWTHMAIALTSTGNTLSATLYGNGKQLSSKSEDAGEATSLAAGTVKIGYKTGSSDLFQGFLAYLKMYRETRSVTQIGANMHKQEIDVSSSVLIVYLYLDQHYEGTHVLDHSSYNTPIVVSGVANKLELAEPPELLLMCPGSTEYDGVRCVESGGWGMQRESDTHAALSSSISLESISVGSLSQVTASVWVWLSSPRTTERVFLDDTDGVQSASLIEISITATGQLWTSLCAVITQADTATLTTEGQWHHVARLASASFNGLYISSVKAASTDSGAAFACPASLSLKIYSPESGWMIARDFALFSSLLPLSTLRLMQDGYAPQSISSLRRFFSLADATRFVEQSMTGTLSYVDHSAFSSHNLWLSVETHPSCADGLVLIDGACQIRRAYKMASTSSSLSLDTSSFGASTLAALQNSLSAGVFTSSLWLMMESAPLLSQKQVIFALSSAGNKQFEVSLNRTFSLTATSETVTGNYPVYCHQLCSKWFYLSVAASSSQFSLFINGFLLETLTFSVAPTFASSAPLLLLIGDSQLSFVGAVASVELTASALSSTQIASSLQKTSRLTGLISLFITDSLFTVTHEDSGQISTGALTGEPIQFFSTAVPQAAQLLETVTVSLPEGTTASSNCAFAISMVYSFSTTSSHSVLTLSDSSSTSLLIASLSSAALSLAIQTGGTYQRDYSFISALNVANHLVIARLPSNELEVAINGRVLERLQLIACDTSSDFHKNSPTLALSSGIVLDQLDYFKGGTRSSLEYAQIAHIEGVHASTDLLMTLQLQTSLVSSRCFLLSIDHISSTVAPSILQEISCRNQPLASKQRCKEGLVWRGQRCVEDEAVITSGKQYSASPLQLPTFHNFQTSALSFQFWIYTAVKSDLSTSRSLFSIPNMSYKVSLLLETGTAAEQIASVTSAATHTSTFSIPLHRWHHLTIILQSKLASLRSNSYAVLTDVAHSDLTVSDFESVYLCGDQTTSTTLMDSCTVQEFRVWPYALLQPQIYERMHYELDPSYFKTVLAYYPLRGHLRDLASNNNYASLKIPHNPTTHADYTRPPQLQRALHADVAGLRMCKRDDAGISEFYAHALNACFRDTPVQEESAFYAYPLIGDSNCLSLPLPLSVVGAQEWTLQFWMKVIHASGEHGDLEILTQMVGSSAKGIAIRAAIDSTTRVAFIPDVEEDAPQRIEIETSVLVEGSWQFVACRSNELEFDALLNMESATLQSHFDVNYEHSSFHLGEVTDSGIKGVFSLTKLRLWAEYRSDTSLRIYSLSVTLPSVTTLVAAYELRDYSLEQYSDFSIRGSFEVMKQESSLELWSKQDRAGDFRHNNLVELYNEGEPVVVVQKQKFALPLSVMDITALSKNLLLRGFTLSIWVRAISVSESGGALLQLQPVVWLGMSHHSHKYQGTFYDCTLTGDNEVNPGRLQEWKKVGLVHNGEAKILKFYLNEEKAGEGSVGTLNRNVEIISESMLLGSAETVFRVKEVYLATQYLNFDALRRADVQDTGILNYWRLDTASSVFSDVKNPRSDYFSQQFSLLPASALDFSGSTALDPALYFCEYEDYELASFCTDAPRFFHVPNTASDLTFLSGVTLAAPLTEISFQVSIFIEGGALAHVTDYALCSLFSLTPALQVIATALTFDVTTGWHHFTLTAAQTTSTLYVDGIQTSTSTLLASLSVTTPSFVLHPLGAPYAYYAREMRLLSQVLTQRDIQLETLNAQLSIRDFEFIAYYPLAAPLVSSTASYSLTELVSQRHVSVVPPLGFSAPSDTSALSLIMNNKACSRGTARYSANNECSSPSQVLFVKQDESQGIAIYHENMISGSSYSLTFWTWIATELEVGTILSVAPQMRILIDSSRHIIFYPRYGVSNSELMKSYIQAERWLQISAAYSNDIRYDRAYLALGSQESQSIAVSTDPSAASLAVFFAAQAQGLAEIDAKLGSFAVWSSYLSVGSLVKQGHLTNPKSAVLSLRFNNDRFDSTLLNTPRALQLEPQSVGLSGSSSLDSTSGLSFVEDTDLVLCDISYNFDYNQCEATNTNRFRKITSLTLVSQLSYDSFTISLWIYLDSAPLTLDYTPLGSATVSSSALSVSRDSSAIITGSYTSASDSWTYIKLSCYHTANWEIVLFQNGAELFSHSYKQNQSTGSLSNARAEAFVLSGPVVRNVAIWPFAIPSALVPSNLFSLDIIVAPSHAWSLEEKSGSTVYADFGTSISSLQEGIEYEWASVTNTCLNVASSCEADISVTLTSDCTSTGKVYPWGTFSQCGDSCGFGYRAIEGNICQETLCFSSLVQDQDYCKEQGYVELLNASSLMELVIGSVVLVFIVFGALLKSPQGNIWSMVFQLQIYYFLIFIKMNFPQNALIIMRGFSFATLGIINRMKRQLGESLFTEDRVNDFSLGIQFSDNGITSTIFSYLYEPKSAVFLGVLAFSFGVAWPCSRLCKKSPKLQHLFTLCSGFNFWARMLLLFYLELCFFVFIGTYNLASSSAVYVLSTVHCVSVLLIITALPFLITASLLSKAKHIARYYKKWKHNVFVSELDLTQHAVSRLFFYPWFLFRRLAIALLLVYLKDFPFWQCIWIGFTAILTMGFIWRTKPRSKFLNSLGLLDELSLTIVCACLALLDDAYSPASSATSLLGNIIVVTIFFNISIRFIGIMLELLRRCCRPSHADDSVITNRSAMQKVKAIEQESALDQSISVFETHSPKNSSKKINEKPPPKKTPEEEKQETISAMNNREQYRRFFGSPSGSRSSSPIRGKSPETKRKSIIPIPTMSSSSHYFPRKKG